MSIKSRKSRGVNYLITGISGFVAGHYLEYLSENKPYARVIGIDDRACPHLLLNNHFKKQIKIYRMSLLDQKRQEELIKITKPDYIVHLASYSSVAFSWKEPVRSFINNTNIFLNIAEAVRKSRLRPRILSIGSSEEYGMAKKSDMPLKEDARLNPISPYAAARVSQEMISMVYAKGYGLPIVCTRSFNHIGPRQSDAFIVSSLARQIVKYKKGKRDQIVCGDLDIVRDFIDVRDAVRAYDLLLEKGRPGEVYNVCSGNGHKLSEILNMLQEIACAPVPTRRDRSLARPADNPIIIGSCEKLRKETRFQRKYDLRQSLTDILAYWENNE